MIRVSIRDITFKGKEIDQVVPKEGIGLTDEEIDLRSPLKVHAHLAKVDNVIVAEARVETEYGYICSRCLENFQRPQVMEYHFDFPLEPDAEYVDLGEEIRQEMIMSNPARILCREDCKGICAKCGANLNTEKCRCK